MHSETQHLEYDVNSLGKREYRSLHNNNNQVYVVMTQLRQTIPESLLEKLRHYVLDRNACIPAGVCNDSLRTLLDSSWLTCDVMNYYLGLLKGRFGGQTFRSNLFDKGERIQKKVLQLDDVLIPLNIGGQHWILLRIRIRDETIEVYDSIVQAQSYYENKKEIRRVKQYLVHHGKAKECWKIIIKTSEQQNDGCSCGVFVLLNAKALRMNIEPPKLKGNIMGYRSKLLCEIMSGQILEFIY
jgi:Ulp1 family protease